MDGPDSSGPSRRRDAWSSSRSTDRAVRVLEGSTILDACQEARGSRRPSLCYGETLRPVNVCRVCVVEVEGARVFAPVMLCKVEPR